MVGLNSQFGSTLVLFNCVKKISHTGDKAALNQCGQQHRYQRNPASKAKFVENQTFFAPRFYTLYEQKYFNLRPFISISFPQGFGKFKKQRRQTLGSGGKKTFKWSDQRKKKICKNFFAAAVLDHLRAQMSTSDTTSFHYFSPRIPNLNYFWTTYFGKLGQKDV